MRRGTLATFYAVWWPQHRILKIGMTTNEIRRWRELCMHSGGEVAFTQRKVPVEFERQALAEMRAKYAQAFATEQEAAVLLKGGRGFTETFFIPDGDMISAVLVAIRELEIPNGVHEAEADADGAVDGRDDDDARPSGEVDGDVPEGVRGRPRQGDADGLDTPENAVPARRAEPRRVRLALARAGARRRDRAVRGGRRRPVRNGRVAGGPAPEALTVPTPPRRAS